MKSPINASTAADHSHAATKENDIGRRTIHRLLVDQAVAEAKHSETRTLSHELYFFLRSIN